MNYASFIVKIVGQPKQTFPDNQTALTTILVKFSQNRNNEKSLGSIFQISIWGNLAYDVAQYYQINDYIVIEGYISIRENLFNKSFLTSTKQIEISVFKIYPFLLKSM